MSNFPVHMRIFVGCKIMGSRSGITEKKQQEIAIKMQISIEFVVAFLQLLLHCSLHSTFLVTFSRPHANGLGGGKSTMFMPIP